MEWAIYSNITGAIVIVFFIASTTGSALDKSGVLPGSPTGLFQRIAINAGWRSHCWKRASARDAQ